MESLKRNQQPTKENIMFTTHQKEAILLMQRYSNAYNLGVLTTLGLREVGIAHERARVCLINRKGLVGTKPSEYEENQLQKMIQEAAAAEGSAWAAIEEVILLAKAVE